MAKKKKKKPRREPRTKHYGIEIPCPCGSRLTLKPSRFGHFYGCMRWPQCDCTVGAHRDTLLPLGTPADRETKQARIKAHEAFDPLWRNQGPWTRGQAYSWLQKTLGLSPEQCHIGMFDAEQCRRVVNACLALNRKETQ